MTSQPVINVQRFDYPVPVTVVDRVPHCPCCYEPMVERGDAWMCALGAALLDYAAAQIDAILSEL